MKNCNFCVHENKVFDLNGFEILPDEENIVTVFFNGMERKFKVDKMIIWLKESGYNNLFKKPKSIPKPKENKIRGARFTKPERNYGFQRRKIICSNGRSYESLYEASKEIGIDRSSICQVLNNKNKRKTVAGLTFKYANNEHITN
jgi:hypothetical protein